MADIQGTLSKKVGPLPLWGWAAAAGGLVSVIYLSRRGSAQGATSASADQTGPPYMSPIIVSPQSMPPSTSSANPVPVSGPPASAPAPDTPVNPVDWQRFGSSYWYRPGGQDAPFTRGGNTYFHLVDPTALNAYKAGGGQTYWFPQPGFPVPGENGAVYGVQPASAGGGSSVMNFVPGSGGGKLLRHASPHAHSQYVATGMGGGVQTGPWAQDPKRGLAMNQGQNVVGGMGGGGHARLQAISQKTGLPMTRLMALNPHAWQPGRPPRGHIHIA